MLSRVKNIGAEVIHLADDEGVSRPFRILFAGFIQEDNQLVLRELFKRSRLVHFCFLLIIIEEYHAWKSSSIVLMPRIHHNIFRLFNHWFLKSQKIELLQLDNFLSVGLHFLFHEVEEAAILTLWNVFGVDLQTRETTQVVGRLDHIFELLHRTFWNLKCQLLEVLMVIIP